MYASFHRVGGLGYRTVSEIMETMQGADIFEMFPEFSNMVQILAVIPSVSCSAERCYSIVAQIENLPPHNHKATCFYELML